LRWTREDAAERVRLAAVLTDETTAVARVKGSSNILGVGGGVVAVEADEVVKAAELRRRTVLGGQGAQTVGSRGLVASKAGACNIREGSPGTSRVADVQKASNSGEVLGVKRVDGELNGRCELTGGHAGGFYRRPAMLGTLQESGTGRAPARPSAAQAPHHTLARRRVCAADKP